MRLLLDNTGFHAVGRCLESLGNGRTDIDDFLRYASYLIFCEESWVSGCQPDAVTDRSDTISQFLKTLGVPEYLRSIRELSLAHLDHAMDQASKRVFEELELADIAPASHPSALADGLLPERRTLQIGVDDWFLEATNPMTKDSRLEELYQDATQASAGGWPVLMILRHGALRQELLSRVQHHGWKPSDLIEFSVRMRYFMNQELAATGPSPLNYAPSAARSKLIASNASFVLDSVNRAISHASEGLDPVTLDLPPVAMALVHRSKGDPAGIISEALALRDRAKVFREHCGKLIDDISSSQVDSHRSRHELKLFMRDCEQLLTGVLHRQAQPSLTDSLDLDFLGFGFIPNPLKLIPWLHHKRKVRRITALLDLSYSLTDYTSNDYAYRKLHNQISRHSKAEQNGGGQPATRPESK
jgi:hypothetical protein